jgi:uncharacterized protein YndB with AHSA1/START domain
MTNFCTSVLIRVPPARVFEFLADPSTARTIDPAVVSYEPEGGTMGLGVHNRIRLRMLGLPMEVVSETTDWKPDERMVFRSIRPAKPVVAVATHRFDAHPDGVIYSWSMEFLPTGFGGQLVARVAVRLFERNARKQQQRVRAALEDHHPGC